MCKDATFRNKVLLKLILFGIIFVQFYHGQYFIHGKECTGSNTGFSYVLYPSRSKAYQDQFRNCKVVNRNLEIVSIQDDIDENFLDTIEEVKGYILIRGTSLKRLSMKKLRLVRGKNSNWSIHIEDNQQLERVLFPSLREISKGGILIKNNTKLCFMDTIKWTEVTYNNSSFELSLLGSECPQCGPNCNNCWSEDTCQTAWKMHCTQTCTVGCTSNGKTCCDPICASGCYNRKDECMDCRSLRNEGKCLDKCPSLERYNPNTMKTEVNPQGRYQFENQCVKECPKRTMPCGGKCEVACLGEDSKEILCNETSMENESAVSLRNCSIIAGPLKLLSDMISNREPSIVPRLDNSLSSVRNITDSLVIQGKHKKFTDLSFLKNLEIIHGLREDSGISLLISHTSLRALDLTSLHTILNGDVWISDNDDLESLDLVSLKSVEGSVTIKNNKNLCFVEKSLFENIARLGTVFVGENKEPELCKEENKTCHEECVGGCWGPGNKQCRFCKHFLFQGECLPTCGSKRDPPLYEEDGKCKKCHHQCERNCTGEGPFNCTECKNAKNDNECVENCPQDKYINTTTKICSPCHSNCKGGCSGPLAVFGSGGCNDCRLLYHNENKCVDDLSFNCTTDKYKKIEDRTTTTSITTNKQISVCYDCHPMCRTCSGEGVACECRHVKLEGACIESCPKQYYIDGDKECQKCHQECDDCYGSSADACYACKNVRIYLNVTLHSHNVSSVLNNTEFVCNSTCPSHISASKEEKVDGHLQKLCYYSDELFQIKQKAMIGLLVLGCIGLICAAVVLFAVRKRQKAKAEENEAKMQAQIEGINAYELLTPSKVRPESLTSLRLIKEAELHKNEEIGSGNFGVVYRGIWHPENEKIRVPVAIKVLTTGSASAQHKELLEEARVMASVSHPCCIRILAVCLSRQMMLITPLVPHGSMLDYLQKNQNKLGSHTMLKWASQISRGMNYLVNKGIVHRNLAARNILIQSVNQVKIADAMIPKIANLLDKDDSSEVEETPKSQILIKWLSLESIQYNIFTHKSDVWSYGITLWELFTYGEKPYKDVSAFDIAEHLEMGERLPQPSICTIDVYMVMIKCWMADASSRPSFQELEEEFCGMSRDPGRFLVIHGDKLMRIPSDFIEDNRSELIRQMNLSDSDDIVCGEDYLSPPSFTFPYRTFSEKYNKLTSVQEEEETSFQTIPEYTNFPNKSSRPSFKHQSSSISSGSGSIDGTFTHLEAASVALEGSRKRKSSARYLGSPSSESSSGDLMSFPQTPRPPSLDEKEVMKLDHAYANKVKGEDYCEPKNKQEDYLEPQTKTDGRNVKNTGIFLENPEYMSQLPNNNFLPSMYQQ